MKTAEKRDWLERHPAVVTRMQQEYRNKIKQNQAMGQMAFTSGEYKPFIGWSAEASKRSCDFTLELDQSSQEQVVRRVTNPLQQLALKYGIPAIFAGIDDQPAHVTFDNGQFKNMSLEKIQFIRNWLDSNGSHLKWLSKILTGLTFHHDTLVLGPSSYICAEEFGDEQGTIYRARLAIEKIMGTAVSRLPSELKQSNEESFAPPYSFLNIFHTSVMRLTAISSNTNLLLFAEEARNTVGEDLKQQPLPVTVQSVFIGPPTDFHQKNKSQFILP